MRKYSEDFFFKIRVKKLAALAFLPVADVIPVFESLATTFLDEDLDWCTRWRKKTAAQVQSTHVEC